VAELLPVLRLAQLAEEMNADSGLVVPLSWHNWGLQLSLDFNKRQESSLSQQKRRALRVPRQCEKDFISFKKLREDETRITIETRQRKKVAIGLTFSQRID